MIIGIDATNITQGGGITHIKSILNNGKKALQNYEKIIIWGNKETLKHIDKIENLIKIEVKQIWNKPLKRFIWQFYNFEKELISYKCDHALILGGIFFLNKIPATIIMQNLLPFDNYNIDKYRLIKKLKLLVQKKLLLKSILKAKNIIFLTKSSKNIILKSLNLKLSNYKIIPHGIEKNIIRKKINKKKFFLKKRIFKILCVSKIEFYKNQIDLIKAGHKLKKKNYDIFITFVGPAYEPALRNFINFQKVYDPKKKYTKYLGNQSFKKTLEIYKKHDLHVTPSSCETFGQIVLEAMAGGVPNLCSNIGVFKEITKYNAEFFKTGDVDNLVKVIEKMIKSNSLRYKLTVNSINYLKKNFSWKKTSQDTFKLISK